MKKIYNEHFDETYYIETLDNGLEITIYHKPNFTVNAFAFGTDFGALKLKQKVDGKEITYHSGLAHFLEHKLFENEKKDVMLEFNSLGANVNAYTSYDSTVYYFTTVSNEVEVPLNLLLDFVQDLNITKESVEKEKGIIEQELKMYSEMSSVRLMIESYKAMYYSHPLINDIGGSISDVYEITKEELELAYNYNYHPSSMKLVIASSIDPEILFDIIKRNQSKKQFGIRHKIENVIIETKNEVNKEYVNEHLDVVQPKVAYAIKLKGPDGYDRESAKKEWGLQIILEIHFSSLNSNYQKWLDKNIISDSFGFEVDSGVGYLHIIFNNDTNDEMNFKKFIEEEIDNLKTNKIQQDLLSEIQKRFYGLAFGSFNETENIVLNQIKYLLNSLSYLEVIDIIEEIDIDYINDLIEHLNYDNSSVIKISKNK